jgi:GNAT superfamily N-acetyltransferase
MPEEFVIREATTDDAPEIARQRRLMYEDIGERDAAALEAMVASTTSYLRKAIPEGTFRAWLAETHDRRVVAGGAVLVVASPSRPSDPRPRRASILNVYTCPEYRRRGIARRIMEHMIAWCRDEGFPSVTLHATDAGRPLYESLGFEPSNEMKLKL